MVGCIIRLPPIANERLAGCAKEVVKGKQVDPASKLKHPALARSVPPLNKQVTDVESVTQRRTWTSPPRFGTDSPVFDGTFCYRLLPAAKRVLFDK